MDPLSLSDNNNGSSSSSSSNDIPGQFSSALLAPDDPDLSTEETTSPSQSDSNATSSSSSHNISSNSTRMIVIPQRSCQGGLDFKFNSDPAALRPYERVLVQQWFGNNNNDSTTTAENHYRKAIIQLNETLKPARAGLLDATLLVTGALLVVPLAVYAMRHVRQQRFRKRVLHDKAIHEFSHYPNVVHTTTAGSSGLFQLYLQYHPRVPGRESFWSIQQRQTLIISCTQDEGRTTRNTSIRHQHGGRAFGHSLT